MRKLVLLSVVVVLMISSSSCVKHVNRVALDALAGVENMSFALVEMNWEEQTPILSVIPNDGNPDYNILRQRKTSTRYTDMLNMSLGYGQDLYLHSSAGTYQKESDSYSGALEIIQLVGAYSTSSDLTQNPSEVIGGSLGFQSFFIVIPYTVTSEGDVVFDEYVCQSKDDKYTSEADHLNCHVESFTPEEVVVVFPDYLLPDFSTDSFRTGKVKMVFRNSLH